MRLIRKSKIELDCENIEALEDQKYRCPYRNLQDSKVDCRGCEYFRQAGDERPAFVYENREVSEYG